MLLHGRVAVNSLPRTLAQLRREVVTAGLVIAAIMVGALSPMGRPVVSEVSGLGGGITF